MPVCLDEAVALSAANFDTYWPHVDNIWSSTGTVRIEKGQRTEYFRCRLHLKGDWIPEGGGKRIQERQKLSQTAMTCLQTMCVVCHTEGVTAEPLTGSAHTHSLDDLDCFKRPSIF